MDAWLVTQGDNQFSVDGLAALIQMASDGRLSAGDMVQPPGASDWVYASEVPALAEHFRDDATDDADGSYRPGGMSAILPAILVAVLLGVIGIGGIGVIVLVQYLPSGDEVLIGEGGMTYSEMIVTAPDASLVDVPDAKGKPVISVAKDSTLELLAKRGDFYRARTKDGAEGWLPVTHVLPMYQLGGERVQEKYDPLYNPDHYVDVNGASWIQLPDQDDQDAKVTVFHFQFRNKSQYDMTDLKIQVTIKDAKGGVLEQRELAIEGLIPKKGETMVGTLKPDLKADPEGVNRLLTETTWDQVKMTDPALQERWIAGLEVTMEIEDFENANVDIVELRAVP